MAAVRSVLPFLAATLVIAACSSPVSTGTASGTAAGEETFVSVVKNVAPSIVEIETATGLGSGVVFDSQGDIVTNAHVVGAEKAFRVSGSDGSVYQATLVGSFPPDDVAVIRISDKDLKPAKFGDSSKLLVGQLALAIGSPLGLQTSVTNGIVSATGRVVAEGDGGGTLPDAIQTSAAINPGNSGGALVDMAGQVIGIPTLAALTTTSSGVATQAPGIGFAISSNRAGDIAGQIVKDGRVTNSRRAYLGIQGLTTTSGAVLVQDLTPNGPAARAGIQKGDRIAAVAGKSTPTSAALSEALAALSPGQTVPVDVIHPDGTKATVQVTLGTLPG
jgi:S1-C subfamily serine protease